MGHGLKSGGSISGGSAFESELPSGGISQAGQGISDFMPSKPIMRLQNVLEILDTAARAIKKAQAYISVALRENDGFDVISKGEADDDFESEEVSEESEGIHLGPHGKIESITGLKSVKPLKSIQEVKSLKEVKSLYELTPKQANVPKRLQKLSGRDGGDYIMG